MPQLHLNQGAQDALLFDNSRSYFTNVGYVRTSNFQQEYRDVDPSNNANLGTTVQFVIPKSGDLLGSVDLMFDIDKPTTVPSAGWVALVEDFGYAAIDRIVFSVGSNDIETITGDQLAIMNELMKDTEHRMTRSIGKTGRPALYNNFVSGDQQTFPSGATPDGLDFTNVGRMISHDGETFPRKSFIIPTGLFFTKHPSQFFPLAAVAGCNDVRISIKFRTINELLQCGTDYTTSNGRVNGQTAPAALSPNPAWNSGQVISSGSCKLRCLYIHTTGPEATTLMNKEHVRLLKLWSVNSTTHSLTGTVRSAATKQSIEIDLSFLHPVTELIFTIRKLDDMSSSLQTDTAITDTVADARKKAYFEYHGAPTLTRGGKTKVGDPNMDHVLYKSTWAGKSAGYAVTNVVIGAGGSSYVAGNVITYSTGLKLLVIAASSGAITEVVVTDFGTAVPGANGAIALTGGTVTGGSSQAGSGFTGTAYKPADNYLIFNSVELTLNGQERMPSLAGTGIGRDYLMERIMPQIHSNASSIHKNVASSSVLLDTGNTSTETANAFEVQSDLLALGRLSDRKEIYAYSFALNPEGANPSGSVNYSKVSHSKLKLNVTPVSETAVSCGYQVDVYACYWNWLQVKDGRALLSFA